VQWRLIDFDMSRMIGVDTITHKCSSTYLPPEAIRQLLTSGRGLGHASTSQNTSTGHLQALLRNRSHSTADERDGTNSRHNSVRNIQQKLLADPSFDIWSLGCILYQLCTPDVRPLFQGGQDDGLSTDVEDEDNIYVLAQWTDATKAKKLAKVSDPLARNLLSQILTKDPKQRPTIARILAHPFLSFKKVARMVGESARYDVFLSYRVNSDREHAERLYNMLTEKGLSVWWDQKCQKPGTDWKEGFCAGLVDSKTFICLLSHDAINNDEVDAQNLAKLTKESPCDNMLLECRLALELNGLHMLDKIFPVFCGELNEEEGVYESFFSVKNMPKFPDVAVAAVEEGM
jgi:serine/threonine protein kinase